MQRQRHFSSSEQPKPLWYAMSLSKIVHYDESLKLSTSAQLLILKSGLVAREVATMIRIYMIQLSKPLPG